MPVKENTTIKTMDKSFFALGTVNYVKITDCWNESVLDLAVNRVYEIDDTMSAFKPGSDVSKLNRQSGRGDVEVNWDTFNLFERSIQFSRMSGGAFDITVRPLVELWGIGKKKNYIPSDSEIEDALKLVNYNELLLDRANCRAGLRQAGQAVDLGGIAKGYAADEVRRILLENGVENALINLGGNIVTLGNRPDGRPWQVGIQNPLAPTGEPLGILSPEAGKTIVTSGSNERFFMKDGVRYHHILDPRTGKPAASSLLSVTAVCGCSMDADALTTALFVLGPQLGLELLEKLGAEAVFLTENREIWMTPDLRENFKRLS